MNTRKNLVSALRIVAPLALLLLLASQGSAGELIFSQYADGQATYGPSSRAPGSPVGAAEVADDFNLSASIERIVARGYLAGPTSDFAGAYVRFYAYGADGRPGALQSETFLPAGDPNLLEQLWPDGLVDITLPAPFSATGQHFVSVQLVLTPAWYRWGSNTDAPHGQAFYFRDPANGVLDWQHGDGLNLDSNADVDFQLYGTVTGAGHIDSLSESTLPRSGYLEIFGSNFGGSGTVQIDGLAAPVADWTGGRIVAYVPETAGLTSVAVQITNSSGQPSNSLPLNVTARQADGRVRWRLRMNGPYSWPRPVIGPDGTIYAVDAFAHLYAISPDGGLKWVVRGAGDKGVAVGADGSVYVGSEYAIRAFNPDGSEKWTFVEDPYAFILVGISVGPDGNVYAVATEGMGVFSLTPGGTLRWQVPEPYQRLIVSSNEIVFGSNGGVEQLYFYANRHLRALTLDGTPVFEIPGGLYQLEAARTPAIGPDGSVHTDLDVYSPAGALLWSFPTPYPYNVFTNPDVGSDGVHYFGQNLSQLFALNPDGSQRWHVALDDYVNGPIVDPTNTQLVMGGADTLDHPGFILSTTAANGQELWRVVLPIEDPTVWNPYLDMWGFNQYVDTRARFAADGQTAYVVTATATGDNATSKSFVYSLDASVGTPPPPPPPAPDIQTISPPSGDYTGGSGMTIGGTGYVVGATVTIGGSPASASVLDPTRIDALAPPLVPGTLNDVTVTNPDSSFATVPNAWLADFLDIPEADLYHGDVERVFRDGITAGYGNGNYGRDDSVTRAQMAVFLLKGEHGASYVPPACTGLFQDVACTPGVGFSDWIEQLARENLTGGCFADPLRYCPDREVRRDEMAVFLLKTEHGSEYIPPACAGIFADVVCTPGVGFPDWIERLANENITGGCFTDPLRYCPDRLNSRGEMAVFLAKTFQLP
jgi:hypothetical protein